MKTQRARLQHLFSAYTDGTITPQEHAELQSLLGEDSGARQLWFLHQDMEAGLHDLCLQRSHFRQGPGINPPPGVDQTRGAHGPLLLRDWSLAC